MKYKVLTLNLVINGEESFIYPVVIDNGEDVVLCDAGYPNQADQIKEGLLEIGYDIKDITKVVVTHHDHDHIGSLKALKMLNPSIKIMASEKEKQWINGEEKTFRLLQAEELQSQLEGPEKEFGRKFLEYLKTIETVPVDITVSEGDYISRGVKVVETPGHTPGHLSIWIEEEELLIAGDAMVIEEDGFQIANPQFTIDMVGTLKSIEKIKQLKPKAIICYHGGESRAKIQDKLNKLIMIK